jgi:hypothetical protein
MLNPHDKADYNIKEGTEGPRPAWALWPAAAAGFSPSESRSKEGQKSRRRPPGKHLTSSRSCPARNFSEISKCLCGSAQARIVLRAYPSNPAHRIVMIAQTRCNNPK